MNKPDKFLRTCLGDDAPRVEENHAGAEEQRFADVVALCEATGDRLHLGAAYINCPTLTLDRMNGAKVLVDAKAGKMATLTLRARFQRDTGKAIIAYLPGRNYGTNASFGTWVIRHARSASPLATTK